MSSKIEADFKEISRLVSRARRDIEDAIRLSGRLRTSSSQGRRVGSDLMRVLQSLGEVSSFSVMSNQDSEEERIRKFRERREEERLERRKKRMSKAENSESEGGS